LGGEHGKEENGEREREREKWGDIGASLGSSRGLLGLGSVSRRWPASSRGKTRTCFTMLEEDDDAWRWAGLGGFK
jgi:hypothetical protein